MRVEIAYKNRDFDGESVSGKIERRLGFKTSVALADVIVSDEPIREEAARFLFSDPVVQDVYCDSAFAETLDWNWLIEIAWRPGVTDTLAITAEKSLELAGLKPGYVSTARQYLLDSACSRELALRVAGLLHNPLVQSALVMSRSEWEGGARPPLVYPKPAVHDSLEPELLAVRAMDDNALLELSRGRLLALTLLEMQAVRTYFSDPEVRRVRAERGLPADATDVEIEMIAQTWSEHCKHKIFNAVIHYTDEHGTRNVNSLFKTYIRAVTETLRPKAPFLRSVFTDNAGVVQFFPGSLVCIKAETHNSPSALDPYGGAITGIVGVNRDILGTGLGAKPIFNTNVLCFGYPDTPESEMPAGFMHPRDIMEGVHKGIVDGGNQSGIPTVAGAFLFDESYRGKPLVFCGTGGILPETVGGKPSWEKSVRPGTLAVMLGGRIGKDGIHGATFSSLALDETSPVSAVQIGDPIIQKRMTDFLLEARDLGLYESITDNGAGGLSSSLGEMAESSGGVRIDLASCPLKYPGLSPWEILVSESQERMSLAVAPERFPEFLELAKRRDVEATAVGTFTNSGYIELMMGEKPVGLLSLDFLHRGLPVMEIPARWKAPERPEPRIRNASGVIDEAAPLSAMGGAARGASDGNHHNAAAGTGADVNIVVHNEARLRGLGTFGEVLLALLAEPNVASKESLIRQYDHEVQARTVEKPFTGIMRDAPSDGGVVKAKHAGHEGLTVTHGICPRYGDADTKTMARMAVDEAYRAHIALGGAPGKAALLDNFCWPDPVESEVTPDGAYKAAQLVRACEGLQEACLAYGLPLVSGKDSMKNDARSGDKVVSVRPTLLVTLLGAVEDVRKVPSTDFLRAGDFIYVLGETRGELGGTMLERLAGFACGRAPDVDFEKSLQLYNALHRAIQGRIVQSCHDCSDGGLAVALAESCIGGRLGCAAAVDGIANSLALVGRAPASDDAWSFERLVRALFSESGGRFVVSVRKEDRERFEQTMSGNEYRLIGLVEAEPVMRVRGGDRPLIELPVEQLVEAFKKTFAGNR